MCIGMYCLYWYVWYVCIVHMVCVICIDRYWSVLECTCVYQQVLPVFICIGIYFTYYIMACIYTY